MRVRVTVVVGIAISLLALARPSRAATVEIPFTSHDGYPMLGKLVLPDTPGPHPVVVHVQTAEGATVDMNRAGRNGPVSYFDLLRAPLTARNVAFFSYEGRGIRNGDAPPRYEAIDRPVYNTSTLENKVRDLITAVQVVRNQPNVDRRRIVVMGTSEGTLLAAEAASRIPDDVRAVVLYAVMATNMREAMRHIFGNGAFMVFRTAFDGNGDGAISPQEFDADPQRYRARVMKGAPFTAVDANGDGVFTPADVAVLAKALIDAVNASDFETLTKWVQANGGVATPDNWFRDHFAHATLWTFLEPLKMPVGLFHGDFDNNTPIEPVQELEARSRAAGKTNLTFQYFAGGNHSLGLGEALTRGTTPPALTAMVDYVAAQVP